jgi:hypothetical protein
MLGRLLCWLGVHKWYYGHTKIKHDPDAGTSIVFYRWRYCSRCDEAGPVYV